MKNSSMCDSRYKIIETLKRNRSTVEELSKTLDISSSAVRQHLTILEGESLVRGDAVKHGMGRPKYVYSLTEEAENFFPKRYHILARSLIEEIASGGEDNLKKAVKNISARMSAPYRKEVSGKSASERMEILQRVLAENGGYAELRKEGNGFYLLNYNCPLTLLSGDYPMLCDIHCDIIKTIVGPEVVREKCMAQNDDCCLFRINIGP